MEGFKDWATLALAYIIGFVAILWWIFWGILGLIFFFWMGSMFLYFMGVV